VDILAEKDLIPMNALTEEKQKELARMGGIASGKAKRQKKNMAQLTAAIMSKNINNLDDLKKDADIKPLLEMIDEDKTMASLMVAGQIRSAMKGNSRAFELITDLNEKSHKQDESNKNYTIPISDITVDFVELYRAVHEAFENGKYREIISKGGRGSIKSNFWAAIAEETIYNDNQAHVVYTRRYKTDLRGSVYNQFMKTIIRHNMLDEWDFTTSPMMAKYKKTGQCVIFVGADKPISLKSYNLSFGYVKLLIHEECDEMAGLEQMDNIEDTFLRSDTFALDIKVFNPPKSANNFMNEYVNECRKKDSTYIAHSYYYNVPVKWLGQRFFERAEWFKQHKPRYYANNYMGEVVGTGGTIFENLETRTITDSEIDSFDSISNGLDFGFEHPQTFIRSYYDHEKDILYPFYEVWARKCKNSTFARKIKEFKNVEIIADSARPDSIAEMQDWGFDIIGAKKRWGSNKGREYCWEWLQQTTKIVIDPERTPKLYEEMSKLEFEQLKDGSFSSQYPTLGEDSIMALIYGLNKTIMESRRENCYDDLEEDDEEYAN